MERKPGVVGGANFQEIVAKASHIFVWRDGPGPVLEGRKILYFIYYVNSRVQRCEKVRRIETGIE